MADQAAPKEVDGGAIIGATTKAGKAYKVKTYNFKRPDKFNKEQIRTFQVLHEAIARNITPALSSVLGEVVTLKLTSVDQCTFQEMMEQSSETEAYAILDMKPLRGTVLMQIDPNLAHTIVHRACGGEGSPKIPDRKLTEVEALVLLDTFDTFTGPINEAWSRLLPLDCRISAIETEKQRALIIPPPEMIILASFAVRIGDAEWYLTAAVPYITLEPILRKLYASYWYRYDGARSNASTAGSRILDIPVDLVVGIDLGRMRIGDLPALVAGQPLRIPDAARVVVSAGGVDVAELEPPVAYPVTGNTLRVVSRKSGPATDALVSHGKAHEKPVAELIGEALSPLRDEIRSLQEDIRGMLADTLELSDDDRADSVADITSEQIRDIAIALSSETEQIAAFVLAPLDPSVSAGILALLPGEMQPGTVEKIVSIGDAAKQLHRRVIAFMSRRAAFAVRQRISGGVESAVKLLNHAPRSVEKLVMDRFKSDDSALFEQIARRMFVFEDFVLVDPSAIGKLAQRVGAEEFALSLRGVQDEVTQHFLAAFEPGYADRVRELLDTAPPARIRDVEAMQREIISELRQLERAGEVVVERPGETV